MKRYEYQRLENAGSIEQLTQLGKQGWLLVDVERKIDPNVINFYIFVREISEPFNDLGQNNEQITVLMKSLLNSPQPQVCKHLVILNILNIIEQNGVAINHALIKAVSDCNDELALEILNSSSFTHSCV